ncbi:MAG: hypothetical protein ACOC7U_09600 [Spirochaetota bacterium]
MKVRISAFSILFLFAAASVLFAQTSVRIGDLPKSDYSINIYEIVGFHQGKEGYKLVYHDTDNEPQYLYLPAELEDQYAIYSPQQNTHNQNFIVIWRKGDEINRVEWYRPQEINYNLPFYRAERFGEKDKKIFLDLVQQGKIIIGPEIEGVSPVIRAPGGETGQ